MTFILDVANDDDDDDDLIGLPPVPWFALAGLKAKFDGSADQLNQGTAEYTTVEIHPIQALDYIIVNVHCDVSI